MITDEGRPSGISPAGQDFRALQDSLDRWDSRRRHQELLRGLPRGLWIGLVIGLVAALLSRVRPLLTQVELALFALAMTLIALSAAGLIVLFRRRTLLEQARFGDRHFRLRERMTAAVEIHTGQLVVSDELAARQLVDATSAASTIDASRDLPLRIYSDDWLPALAALVILVVVLLLPNPQEAILLDQRALAATIEEQARTLEELAEEIAANDDLTAEQREATLRPLDEALAALQEPDLSREEAVAALSQAEDELRNLSQELDNADLRQALAEAAAALDGAGAAGDLAEELQNGQLSQAGAAVGALADGLDSLSAGERQALAEELAQAAADLQAADPALADSLERAADALAGGDVAAAQEALNEAAEVLGEQARSTAAAGQAGSAADRLDEARGEIAQSGSGEQAGAGGEGQGQNGGSADTGGNTPGGPGGQQGNVGGPSQGGGHVESVFVPGPANLGDEGVDLELQAHCLADPESCGPLGGQTPSGIGENAAGGGLVPYDQVFGDYRDAAFEALSGGNIPISLQGIIRDYFSALEP